MSGHREGEWLTTNARGRSPIGEFGSQATATFCRRAAPGLSLSFPALFSRVRALSPPGLTGTTTLSRETAPARAVSVFRTTATEELFLDTAGTNASCKKTAPETRQ